MIKSVKPLGAGAVLIEWDPIISENTLDEIAELNKSIQQEKIPGIIDIVPAYASLTVFFKPEVLKFADLVYLIYNLQTSNKTHQSPSTIGIDIKYSAEYEKDMLYLMNFTGLKREEIINIHSSVVYRVCFIGFLPGFLYLSGLDPALYIPRKAIPDLNISPGSVAIGGQQTGIYPQQSPGGWYVIGRTDFKVIDLYRSPYCKLHAGDKVIFKEREK